MLMKSPKLLYQTTLVLIAFLSFCLCGQAQNDSASGSSYDELVADANSLLKQGRLDEARQTVQQAIQQNPNGYMAYAVAAKIAAERGASADVTNFLQKALKLAPDDDSAAKIPQLSALLALASAHGQSKAPAALSDEDRLMVNVLNLLLDKADKAATPEERAQWCGEILSRSGDFLKTHPKQANVWVIRGVAAVVLNRAQEASEAGQHLQALGMMHSQSPDVSHLFAELELDGWLKHAKAPQPDQRWTNSLGQVFVPVPGTSVLFCIWDTRVEDFEAFVDDTGYDATQGMYSLGKDEWKQRGDTWKSPGFVQGLTDPVCGVNWDDAQAFCRWLTEKEQAMGLLKTNQSYRLPSDGEWSMTVGNDPYPWGNQWPPPAGAGNYAGAEAADGNWPRNFGTIPGYQDGFARTSPVESFAANRLGLFDMGGNVWQWCEDWYRKEMNSAKIREKAPSLNNDGGGQQYRVLRGASWFNYDASYPLSAFHFRLDPGNRCVFSGFRCVLVAGGVVR
jgi:hypothetical protein